MKKQKKSQSSETSTIYLRLLTSKMENDGRLFSFSRIANSAITHPLDVNDRGVAIIEKGPHSKGGAGNLNLMKID
jgi:hypothetical protein